MPRGACCEITSSLSPDSNSSWPQPSSSTESSSARPCGVDGVQAVARHGEDAAAGGLHDVGLVDPGLLDVGARVAGLASARGAVLLRHGLGRQRPAIGRAQQRGWREGEVFDEGLLRPGARAALGIAPPVADQPGARVERLQPQQLGGARALGHRLGVGRGGRRAGGGERHDGEYERRDGAFDHGMSVHAPTTRGPASCHGALRTRRAAARSRPPPPPHSPPPTRCARPRARPRPRPPCRGRSPTRRRRPAPPSPPAPPARRAP